MHCKKRVTGLWAGRQTLLLLALLVLASLGAGCGDPGAATESLSARQAWKLVSERPEDLTVLDVRTPDEVAGGVISGAVVLNFYASDFKDRLAKLDRERTYLVYCHSGGRSAVTVTMMRSMGFTRVRHMGGGTVEWLRGGLPLARSGNG